MSDPALGGYASPAPPVITWQPWYSMERWTYDCGCGAQWLNEHDGALAEQHVIENPSHTVVVHRRRVDGWDIVMRRAGSSGD